MEELKYFFSYARKDSEFVLKLAQDLRAVGVNLWLDQLDILGGREWDREVEGALKNCRGMIAVLSPESVASDNVMNEVSYALEEGRLVVPVLLHPCDKPFRLRRLQHIDFTTGYDKGFSQLLRALGIKQPSQPPEPGPPERSFVREVTETLGDRPVEPPITEPSSIRTEPPEPETAKPEPIGPWKPKTPGKLKRSRLMSIGVPAGLVLLFLIVGLLWYFSVGPPVKPVVLGNQPVKPAPMESPPTKPSPMEKSLVKPVPVEKPPEEIPAHGEKLPEPTAPKTITNTIGMKFVLIPAGTFQMGSSISPEELFKRYGSKVEKFDVEKLLVTLNSEYPLHQVTISKPFYLQTTEVTQGQWQGVMMGNNPSHFNKCGKDCPVENVSWNDAQEFITRLNQSEKTKKYRLPTEAEWEYACRAGSNGAFYFGDDGAELGKYAWYEDNSKFKTYPVGRRKANDWGLHDMLGNVYEWCQDWKGAYPDGPVPDPKGPPAGKFRVLRGGSYLDKAITARSALRGYRNPDRPLDHIGFRVARDF